MNADRDFDRIARAWLDLMPNEVPDRAVDAVLDTIVATPQVGHWRRSSWRSFRMNRLVTALGAAALVAAVSGVILMGRPSTGVGAPTPTLSPTPSAESVVASQQIAEVPVELRHYWIPKREKADRADSRAATGLDITRGSVAGVELGHRVNSLAGQSGAGHLTLTANDFSDGCQAGDVGTYDYTLSPHETTLTVTLVADPCTTRNAVIPGEWARTNCQPGFNPNPPLNWECYGDLDAGTYESQRINFRGEDGVSAAGSFTYTVPEGWSNAADEAGRYLLIPTPDYAHPETGWWGIFLLAHPQAASQAGDCGPDVESGVGRSASALVDWIVARPGVIASTPREITIDGHPGRWLDVKIDPQWTKGCPGDSSTPMVPLIYANTGITGVSGDVQQRWIFFDIGPGETVMINVQTVDPARFDAFVSQAMPIIDTFHFR